MYNDQNIDYILMSLLPLFIAIFSEQKEKYAITVAENLQQNLYLFSLALQLHNTYNFCISCTTTSVEQIRKLPREGLQQNFQQLSLLQRKFLLVVRFDHVIMIAGESQVYIYKSLGSSFGRLIIFIFLQGLRIFGTQRFIQGVNQSLVEVSACNYWVYFKSKSIHINIYVS